MKNQTLFILLILFTTSSQYSQWIEQILPVSGNTYSIVFMNTTTGFISMDNPIVLKTTNGGNNWVTTGNFMIYNLYKIDSTTVYGNGKSAGLNKIYRTTNFGMSWDSMAPTSGLYCSLSFINKDTGWISSFDSSNFCIYFTTNGGATLIKQTNSAGYGQIFFLKQKINGYYMGWNGRNTLSKTTSSGLTWFQMPPITISKEIFFIDPNTGWVCNGFLFMCTDGGINWIHEPMPEFSPIVSSEIYSLVYVGNDKLYGVGGQTNLSNYRGIIWVSTNGGLSWGYQQPDPNINIDYYNVLSFVDSLNGWAYNANGNKGIHTTNGGGIIIYSGVKLISEELPKEYRLFQNYPNPFNPSTIITYQLTLRSQVTLTVFDVFGRKIAELVNERQKPGTYEVTWDPKNLSSGVYFYKIESDKFVQSKKMLLVK